MEEQKTGRFDEGLFLRGTGQERITLSAGLIRIRDLTHNLLPAKRATVARSKSYLGAQNPIRRIRSSMLVTPLPVSTPPGENRLLVSSNLCPSAVEHRILTRPALSFADGPIVGNQFNGTQVFHPLITQLRLLA